MTISRLIFALICVAMTVTRSSQVFGAAETNSDASGKLNLQIPKGFGAGQVGSNSRAFQFNMPEGTSLTHDYGLEGMPDTRTDQTVYPVVINEVQFHPSGWSVFLPTRQLANILVNSSLWGTKVSFLDGMVVLNPEKSINYFTFYYARLAPSPGGNDDTNALFRCPNSTMSTSSSCDGWEYSADLDVLFHIRFPRYKPEEFRAISAVTLRLISQWQR